MPVLGTIPKPNDECILEAWRRLDMMNLNIVTLFVATLRRPEPSLLRISLSRDLLPDQNAGMERS